MEKKYYLSFILSNKKILSIKLFFTDGIEYICYHGIKKINDRISKLNEVTFYDTMTRQNVSVLINEDIFNNLKESSLQDYGLKNYEKELKKMNMLEWII